MTDVKSIPERAEPVKTDPVKAVGTLDVDAIAAALRGPDDGPDKERARAAVKAMTGTWEHLPVRIRAAVRTDIGRFVTAGKSRDDIIAAGYSGATTDRALRDLGQRG